MFGKCLAGDPLDREIGDLIGARGPVASRLFTYVRYNADVSLAGIEALGLAGKVEPEHVQLLDSVDYIDEIQLVGRTVATRQVRPEHFAQFA